MGPGSTTAGTTGGRPLTGTFRTGEDRLRSTNAVTVLDVPEPHDARFCEKLLRTAGVQVDTPEVLLSNQGLIENCSFERLKCLEALWLNGNKLTKIQGLDTNMQLKSLYLQDNRITTLKGSLQSLRHLEYLALQNNRLTDLEATLKLMQHLSRLEELDLSGNPVANELNYRPRVIYRFPKLHVLDRHVIEWEERQAAIEMFEGKKMSNLGFGKRKPLWRNPKTQPLACLSALTKAMYADIEVDTRKTVRASAHKRTHAHACGHTHTHTHTHTHLAVWFKCSMVLGCGMAVLRTTRRLLSTAARSRRCCSALVLRL